MPTALIGVKCGSKDDGEHIAAEQMSRRLHPLPPLRIRRRSIHPHRPLIDDPYNTHSAFAHNLVELSTSIDCTTLPETIGFGHCQSPDLITGQFHQRHLFAPFRNIHLSTIVHPTLDTLEPLHPAAMPYRLDTHVLTVDANVIHKVDTGNPANLYSMWTVFSRCADSVEQGRRLENLSWRLWQREQLIDNAHRSTVQSTKTAPRDIPSEARLPELPQLSGSVDSLADEDTPEFTSVSAPLEIRPRIRRLDSSASRRDRHISSDDFEKMVVSIVKDKAPLSAPTQTSPLSKPVELITRSGSTTTESRFSELPSEVSLASAEMESSSPKDISGIPVFQAPPMPSASIDDCIPEPSSSPAHKPIQTKKQPARFALGASCSSSDSRQSVEARKSILASKKPMFQIGGSSEEESSLASGPAAKQTSFSSNNITHHLDAESAIDSDTEGEYIDESAIDDDDDSSDWEDSIDESGKPSVDEKFFQRVESKVNLTSRPSLITLMLAQNDRAMNLGNQASQSTSALTRSRSLMNGSSLAASPNDSDDGPLMMKGMRQSTLKPINEIPRSSAQPIVATTNHVHAQAALSPRTTRRNMLATELTESLRRHLLWERQQKSSTANAVLKRRHTSHDVANLKQYPERPCLKQAEDVNASSWNQYFTKEANNGYHSKGW
ncbi:uncharacterized protein TRIVIDRAFT_230032 [Trichoderma virens Gv29-8]|uniref:Uncharacterized protein n=1 Tax=Hypocrea virens (strain Gv29-8 / FGSC 10586) TaxID=413071 RepID=G9ML05_HYPVG|nr:uncharacterized protein TRIVIDRAFT_230032 [Trichoderma virens Gv29-8]EHK24899.1 hypothetical protein TRIVIDRAFT_230032 [Trichoderma virens Gv29-8]